ncbi:hypothetical protein LHU53_12400 [Rhodoferax sp. U2-2l]|uniref:hypothetical protein n=1 Tax=Rhodoferax sp. U2-2l TaxID=2884000 RepID=UPI001D0A76FF|nr:hypothetical protein [Rhodoferax sp. U2-2l]MCB8747705.1 hypothetical protein [Rhodoferax sp. U2-2l]
MNELQKEAFNEGTLLISEGFAGNQSIDLTTLRSWLDGLANGHGKIEKKRAKHDRDEDDNLVGTTSTEITHSEYCGYRLSGAFRAVEAYRAAAQKSGVNFSGDLKVQFK